MGDDDFFIRGDLFLLEFKLNFDNGQNGKQTIYEQSNKKREKNTFIVMGKGKKNNKYSATVLTASQTSRFIKLSLEVITTKLAPLFKSQTKKRTQIVQNSNDCFFLFGFRENDSIISLQFVCK